MFLLALRARIIAAGMKVLGLNEVNGNATKEKFPADESRQDQNAKQRYVRKIATTIVDEHILDHKTAEEIINSCLLQEEQERAIDSQQMTSDGRFACRY